MSVADARKKAVIERHRSIVPPEYEITPDDKGFFIQVDKRVDAPTNDGYGPDAMKLFVQPKPEKYMDVLRRTLGFLLPERNVTAKFMDIRLPQDNFSPSQERIVVYTDTWQELRDVIARLCDGFGVDCYLFGSAPEMTSGRYSGDYGARFTQQINPMLHLRVGGRVLHEGVNGKIATRRFFREEREYLGEYAGNADPTLEEAKELRARMTMREDFMWDMGDYSLEKGGILQLKTSHGVHLLDPRKNYFVGREDVPNPGICLPAAGVAKYHALVRYETDEGYVLTDKTYSHHRNRTYVDGERIDRARLQRGQTLRFGTEEVSVENALY